MKTARLCVLALVACCDLVVGETRDFSARIVGISDGDTVRALQDGVSSRVRLWGIDCPERGQAFGTRAREFTAALSFGTTVIVRVHDVDRYGRLVAEIILPDGRNLNHEVVRAGFAWWYSRYARSDKDLKNLEAAARAAKRGLWVDQTPIPPWDFRKKH